MTMPSRPSAPTVTRDPGSISAGVCSKRPDARSGVSCALLTALGDLVEGGARVGLDGADISGAQARGLDLPARVQADAGAFGQFSGARLQRLDDGIDLSPGRLAAGRPAWRQRAAGTVSSRSATDSSRARSFCSASATIARSRAIDARSSSSRRRSSSTRAR